MFTVAPHWRTIGSLASDAFFLDCLERVFAGTEALDSVVARYQRGDGYSAKVLRHVISEAVEYAQKEARRVRHFRAGRIAERRRRVSRAPTRRELLETRRARSRHFRLMLRRERRTVRSSLRIGVMYCAPSVGFAPGGDPSPQHRKRWRTSARDQAVDVLLSRGAGLCIVDGCEEAAEAKHYCSGHSEMQRTAVGVARSIAVDERAPLMHDQALEACAAVLKELGEAIGVDRD